MSEPTAQIVDVDCRGMQCPAPILHVAKAARNHKNKPALLKVVATDSDFPRDIAAWCRTTRSELLELNQGDNEFEVLIGLNGAKAPDSSMNDTQVSDAAPAPSTLPVVERREHQHVEPPAPGVSVDSTVLDCRQLQCPAPILEVAKSSRKLSKRAVVLRVLATDRDFPRDIGAWCRTTRNTLIRVDQRADWLEAVVGLGGVKEAPSFDGQDLSDSSTAAVPEAASHPAAAPAAAMNPLPPLPVAPPTPPPAPEAAPAPAAPAAPANDMAAMLAAMTAAMQEQTRATQAAQARAEQAMVQAATMQRQPAPPPPAPAAGVPAVTDTGASPREHMATLLVLHNDFEALMAALMVANTAASQGLEVQVFLSFWGVNLMRADKQRPGTSGEKVGILQKMMKMMMPAGPDRQKLSQMNMGGLGIGMMKYLMRKRNIMSMREMLEASADLGVQFTMCTMSMGLMGVRECDLIDLPGLQFGGVTSFVESAQRASVNLVF